MGTVVLDLKTDTLVGMNCGPEPEAGAAGPWTTPDFGRAHCKVKSGSPSSWPMLELPNCNLPDANDNHMCNPFHWCRRKRFSRPAEDCLGIPSVALADALWSVAQTANWSTQLSPDPCRVGKKWNLPPDGRINVLSGDSSQHLGGLGGQLLADVIATLMLRSMWELGIAPPQQQVANNGGRFRRRRRAAAAAAAAEPALHLQGRASHAAELHRHHREERS